MKTRMDAGTRLGCAFAFSIAFAIACDSQKSDDGQDGGAGSGKADHASACGDECGPDEFCNECPSDCPPDQICPAVCGFPSCEPLPEGLCCDPAEAPPSFEPVQCCENGSWASTGSGNPCGDLGLGLGEVCEPQECFSDDDCGFNEWCNTCPSDCPPGQVCPAVCGIPRCEPTVPEPEPACCNPADEPPAFEPVQCCDNGQWASKGSGNPCGDLGLGLGEVCQPTTCSSDEDCGPQGQCDLCPSDCPPDMVCPAVCGEPRCVYG
jgi:hypothetical protein